MTSILDRLREDQVRFGQGNGYAYDDPKWALQLDEELTELRRRLDQVETKFPVNNYTKGIALERHIHDLSRHPGAGGALGYDYIIDDSYTGLAGASSTSLTGQVTYFFTTIAAAFAHAVSAGGNKSFLILAGTYIEEVAVVLPSNVDWNVYGVGSGVVYWQASANNQELLTLTNTGTNDFRLQGIRFNLSTFTGCRAIDEGTASGLRLHIEECHFTGTQTNSIGIDVESTPFLGVKNCTFDGSIRGIQSASSALSIASIIGNFFACGTGIRAQGNRNTIAGNQFQCSVRDIELINGISAFAITGNEFAGQGIFVNPTTYAGLTIAGNTFRTLSGTASIDFSGVSSASDALSLVGNTFTAVSGATVAILLDSSMASGVISNNTFTGFTYGNEINGSGGTALAIFHNETDSSPLALPDQGQPTGHSTTELAAPNTARYFTLFAATDLTNEVVIGESGASTIDTGEDILFRWTEGNRRDFQLQNTTASGSAVYLTRGASGGSNVVLEGYVGAETNPDVQLTRDRLAWGVPGTDAAPDIAIIRHTTAGTLRVQRLLAAIAPVLEGLGNTDTQPRWRISATGFHRGPGGSTALDTNFTRAAAAEWQVGNLLRFPATTPLTNTGNSDVLQLYADYPTGGALANAARLFYKDDQDRVYGPLGLMTGIFAQQSEAMGYLTPNELGAATVSGLSLAGFLDSSGFQVLGTINPTDFSGNRLRFDVETGATINTTAGLSWPIFNNIISIGVLVYAFQLSSVADVRAFFGLTDQTLTTMCASDTPAGNYIGLMYSPTRGANWYFIRNDGTTPVATDLGVAAGTGINIAKIEKIATGYKAAILQDNWSESVAATTIAMTFITANTRLVYGLRNLAASTKQIGSCFSYLVGVP